MDLLSFWLFSFPVKFDMGAYTSLEDSKLPVTLRISKTRLFVSAQNEDEPVLLKVSRSQSPVYLHLYPICLWMIPIDRPLARWHRPPLFLPVSTCPPAPMRYFSPIPRGTSRQDL